MRSRIPRRTKLRAFPEGSATSGTPDTARASAPRAFDPERADNAGTDAPVLLCVHCRRLIERPRAAGYRVAADDATQCPHCAETGAVDPRLPDVAMTLQAMDADERLARASPRRQWLGRAAVAITVPVAMLAVTVLLVALFAGVGSGHAVYPVLAVAGWVLAIVPMALVGARAVARYWSATRLPLAPARWALALPAGPVTDCVEVVVSCREPLYSPLTGQPCVGYEIGIRRDANADGAHGTWLLLEQRCTAVTAGDEVLDAADVALQLPRQPCALPDDDPRLVHLMRGRGLNATREPVHVFETVLSVGSTVMLVRHDNGVCVLSPASPRLALLP